MHFPCQVLLIKNVFSVALEQFWEHKCKSGVMIIYQKKNFYE